MTDKNREDTQGMDDFEVTELDDADLEDVAGGALAIEEDPNNNCGCNNDNCSCGR